MRTFDFHASSKDDHDIEAVGFFDGIQITATGDCAMDCDGNISVTFITQYSEAYGTDYFFGHLLSDGSLVGTVGYDNNCSSHDRKFILKQTAAEHMCYRPIPEEFAKNKIKALWNFAYATTCAQVRRRTKPKHYFTDQSASRERLTELVIRYFKNYGRYLDSDEVQALSKGMKMVTSCEVNLRRLFLDWRLKLMPYHQ